MRDETEKEKVKKGIETNYTHDHYATTPFTYASSSSPPAERDWSSARFSSPDRVSRIFWNPWNTPAWLVSLIGQLDVRVRVVGDLRPSVDLVGTCLVLDLLDVCRDDILAILKVLGNL